MMQKTKEKEAQKDLRSIANTPTNMGCMNLCELLPVSMFHYGVISVSRLALDSPSTGSEQRYTRSEELPFEFDD